MNWSSQLQDENKLKKILALTSIIDADGVVHAISCYPMNKAKYVKMLKKLTIAYFLVNIPR